MRMSDKLRRIFLYPCYTNAKDITTIEQAADLLDVYYIQCTAAMKAQSLGLCKKSIKCALEEDV